jgi:hypothetical protein
MAEPKAILKRFRAAEGRKSNWETYYEDALDYYAPQFETFTKRAPGDQYRGQGRIFDSTPQSALMKFASNLQSSLVPPMKSWIKLVPGKSITENRDEAAKQLEDITDSMFAALKNSNFDTQVAESFLDLAMGTGALQCFKGTETEPIRFVAVPLSEIFFDEGPHGRVDAAFRRFEIPMRAIEETWPDATIPESLASTIKTSPDKKIKIIEATIPEEVEIVGKDGKKKKIKGYSYSVITNNGLHKLVDRKQASSPWVIFRWSVRPGEIYGRGPAIMALSDTKTLNKTKEFILKNAHMAVSGAYTVADDGIINVRNIRVKPGAMIPVTANPGGVSGPTISALPRTGDFNVGQLVINDLRNSINEIMFADPLGPVDLPVKTATEVSIRQQELAKRIGSAFGRLQFEFINPLINRVLFVLDEMDVIDIGDFVVDGRFIDVEHISPLAQAQEQEELLAIERLLTILNQAFGPQIAAQMINIPGTVGEIADLLNIKKDLVPSPQQAAQMLQALSQAGGEAGAI